MTTRIIIGVKGLGLTPTEITLLKAIQPFGIILFGRNIHDGEQLTRLIDSVQYHLDRENLPVFVDQEGGRVRRLKPPLVPDLAAPQHIGKLYETNPNQGARFAYLHGRILADGLNRYGINITCFPSLDLHFLQTHDVIGDRALSSKPLHVVTLALEAIRGVHDGGVATVIKHAPGHGRAEADSHKRLPHVTASRAELEESDFIPFQQLNHQQAMMTAHIRYQAIDDKHPATLSPTLIQTIIREHFGFDGLLISDDLSMAALGGSLISRVEKTLAADVDIALYCRAEFHHLRKIAELYPPLEGKSFARAEKFIKNTKQDVQALGDDDRQEYTELWRRAQEINTA